MSNTDIPRNDTGLAIVYGNAELLQDHKKIALAEKENQIKGLELQLERIKTIEMKRRELQIKTLKVERENVIKELENLEKTGKATILDQ
jgi:hypothetical protein